MLTGVDAGWQGARVSENKRVFELEEQDRFRLGRSVLERYRGRQPKWGYGALSRMVFARTYARPVERETRQEEWWETIRRTVEGQFSNLRWHCRNAGIAWDHELMQPLAERAMRGRFGTNRGVLHLPPGRGLWSMGTHALEVKGALMAVNCSFVSTQDVADDFAGPFCDAMDFLMLGVGVGFDVRGAGTMRVRRPARAPLPYVVADTREGWVEAMRVLLGAFAGKWALPSGWDVSGLRRRGAVLNTVGGTSSGPEPLVEALETIAALLWLLVDQPLPTSAIVDMMTMIGRCVVAGGVRRSAMIALGDADDTEFRRLKDPSELRELNARLATLPFGSREYDAVADAIARHPLMTHRWASNNSVFCRAGQDYREIADAIVANGEPGVMFLENIRAHGRTSDLADYADEAVLGVNPCSEIPLQDREVCNLADTFPAHHESLGEWLDSLEDAYLYCKSVTLIPTHNAKTNAIVAKNRRIGVSIAGVAELYDRLGVVETRRWLDAGYSYLKQLDEVWSERLGVPRSVRVSTVKPSGSVGTVAGVEGSMKFPIAQHYIRTVRVGSDSPMVAELEAAGYHVEPSVTEPNTAVVSFPCKAPAGVRSAKEVSLREQAEVFSLLQRHWADNAVSATLTFQEHERGEIADVIAAHDREWKSCSFLPLADHGYAQAPFAACSRETYDALAGKIREIERLDAIHDSDERYCQGDACTIVPRG